VIEAQYLFAVAALAAASLKSRLRAWLIWKVVPREVTSIQLYRSGPAYMTGDDLRLSTAPETLYRNSK